jgi:endonuclease I
MQLSAQDDTYYNSLNPTSATFVSDLKARLRTPYTRISYDSYDETNVANYSSFVVDATQRGVLCVYSGYQYTYTPVFTWSVFSREHTWCQSWMPVGGSLGYDQYNDQNHLFPTEQIHANGVRSNHPLGIVTNVTNTFYDAKFGTNSSGKTVYEPRDKHKGDAARALLYMCIRYDDIGGYNWNFNTLNAFLPKAGEAPQDLNTLLLWNSQDPPDKWEVDRNNFIQANQQNRNPFVDHPEYVYYINFNDLTKLNPAYSTEPANNATNFSATINGTSVTLNWTAASPGAQAPSAYLLEAYNTDNYFVPVDGIVYTDDADLSDGIARVNVDYANSNYTFNNINPSLSYYFKIYSYNGNGSLRNYKINNAPKTTTYIGTYSNSLALDNFNRANSTNIGNTITANALTWNKIETVSNSSIQIVNNMLRLGSTTSGREFAYLDLNSVTGYPVVPANATSIITWAFNFRQTRAAPSGFDNNNYGMAFILGKTTNDATTGDGYAVLIGDASNLYRIRLASFSGGLDANANFTNLITGSGFTNDYLNVKVTFNPNGSKWSLYAENNSSAFLQSDPRNTATQIGNTISSSAFTQETLRYQGCFWNHATGATDFAYFDDLYVSDPGGALPVCLSAFNYTVSENNVKLNWITSAEQNNKGFEIQRHDNLSETGWTTLGFINGRGNSNSPTSYSFTDKNLKQGKYIYRLKQIDFNGNFTFYNLSGEVDIESVKFFVLMQNYPNPFNPVTVIKFVIPPFEGGQGGMSVLKVYDVLGQLIATLVNKKLQPGTYEIPFSINQFPDYQLSSGIYFYKLQTGNFTEVKRMVLLK